MPTTLTEISNEKIKARWQEPYLSSAVNTHTAAMPAGILYGFTIKLPSARIIQFSPDEVLGYSFARVRTDQHAATYMEEDELTFDLAAHAGTTIYIGINVVYEVEADTVGTIKAYSAAEYNVAPNRASVLWLCAVSVPGSGSLVAANVDTSVRSRAWLEQRSAPDRDPWIPLISDPMLLLSSTFGLGILATGDATLVRAVSDGLAPFCVTGANSGASSGIWNALGSTASVTPGSRIRYRFRYKSTGATATTVGLRFRFRGSDLAILSGSQNGPSLNNTTAAWTVYEKEILVPDDCYFVGIEVGAQNFSVGEFSIETIQVWAEAATSMSRGLPALNVAATQIALLPAKAGDDHFYLRYEDEDVAILDATGPQTLRVGANITTEFQGAMTVPAVTHQDSVSGAAMNWMQINTASGLLEPAQYLTNVFPGITWEGLSPDTIFAFHSLNLPYGAVITKIRLNGQFTTAGTSSSATLSLFRYTADSMAVFGEVEVLGSVELNDAVDTFQQVEDAIEATVGPTATDGRLAWSLTIVAPVVPGTPQTVGIRCVDVEYTINKIG